MKPEVNFSVILYIVSKSILEYNFSTMGILSNEKKELISVLENIFGRENVLYSAGELAAYAFDSTNKPESKMTFDAAVFPQNTQQISSFMKYAYEHSIPVTPRSAGTSVCGAALPQKGGIVLVLSKMNKILEINKDNLNCIAEPGVIVQDLKDAAEKLNLFYPPDPSNLRVSMIGGSIGMSSGGPHTFKYGSTKDYVIGLEVVLADGSIINTGGCCAKDVTGYNMTQLFIGSEGTLGIITKAVIRLIPKPEAKRVMLAYFDTLEDCAKTANDIISSLITPSVIDMIDKYTLKTIEDFYPSGLLTDKEAALLIEIDGFKSALDEQYNKIIDICRHNRSSYIQTADNKEEEEKIWTARRAAFGAAAKLAPDVLTEDVVVPRSNIVPLVRGIQAVCSKYRLKTCIMGHIGDGNIHPNFALDLRNPKEREAFEKAKDEIFELALSLNGRLSGEHGIGSEKAKYIPKALDSGSLKLMKQIKNLLDSKGILNPGKIF